MFSEYRDRVSECLRLANPVVAFGETAIPRTSEELPLADNQAAQRGCRGIKQHIGEQGRGCAQTEEQSEKQLRSLGGEREELDRTRMRGRTVICLFDVS